jgi:hypothetical protein
MNEPGKKILSQEEIDRVSSVYLKNRGLHDSWEITGVEIEGRTLTAGIRMRSYFSSPTDQEGFHLAMYPPIEFISQLMIIYVHVWAGLHEKTQEGWMIESSFSSKRAIRDPENIKVRMDVTSIRKLKEKIYIIAESKVTDRNGGLFEAWMKCLLS